MGHDEHHDHHEPQGIWAKYIFSQDHKVIAVQYTIVALAVGGFGMVLSWMIRLQLGFPGEFDFIRADNYLQFVTQHGMIMVVYLLTALLLGGFGNYCIPLMIGARDMAFPVLNMLSFWTYFVSVILMIAAFFVPGGASGGGWTLNPPQSILPGASPGAEAGIQMLIASLAVFVIAGTMGGLNYVTTVLQLRTKGMTLMRMPLTVWSIFIASILALLAFPALFVGGVMLFFDSALGTSFFIPTVFQGGKLLAYEGGNPILYQHLFWYFGHPEVYIVILPAMGVASDIISTNARKPIFGYSAMVWSMIAIAVISFIVWAHHMFISGMNPFFGYWFAIATLIIAVPSAVKTFNWVFTLWEGNLQLNTPMLFAIGFVSTFIIGGLTGLFLGNVIADVPLHDTYFVIAHFHLVMGISAILGIFAGIYYWYPKVTGRLMNEKMGKTHFWATFVGAYLIFFPMFMVGVQGLPRRYFSFSGITSAPESVGGLNTFISVWALIVGVAQIIFLVNLVISWKTGKEAGHNPWRSAGLEWQTPDIVPGHGNWGAETPVVTRWPYEYSTPGAAEDFIAQDAPAESGAG